MSDSAQRFWERYFRYYDTLLESIPYRDAVERLLSSIEVISKPAA